MSVIAREGDRATGIGARAPRFQISSNTQVGLLRTGALRKNYASLATRLKDVEDDFWLLQKSGWLFAPEGC